MIWLQKPPWIRWTLALIIAAVSVWVEFFGDASVDHPFAISEISPGEPITEENVEMRSIPAGVLEPVEAYGVANRAFAPGDPITGSGISDRAGGSPEGWWALELAVPPGAQVGDAVQLVLVDSGLVVPGRVEALNDSDPLSSGMGSVAVPPEDAAAAATAVSAGRVVVLVAAG